MNESTIFAEEGTGYGKVVFAVFFAQMKVHVLTEKESPNYEKFVKNHPLGSIHQTSQWGEFQTKLSGRDKFWRIVVEGNDGTMLASALVIRQTLPLKKCWLYSPRGPLADYKNPEALQKLLQKIRELGVENTAVFFRFDPSLLRDETIDWKLLNARPAHAHYQPENTLILDLNLSGEELLKQMKPKGRYNIKVAQKHGVKIRESGNETKDIDAFYSLLQQTTGRDAFSGHNKKYYEDMLGIFDLHGGKADPQAKLYLAEYEGKPVAGMIVTYFSNTATYYFGASSNEHRNVMAPYLLQWQAIQDAKKHGCGQYDFLGIAPSLPGSPDEVDKAHPWAGVTDFKLKFGGKRVDYQPAREIVYRPLWYFIIRLVKKLTRR